MTSAVTQEVHVQIWSETWSERDPRTVWSNPAATELVISLRLVTNWTKWSQSPGPQGAQKGLGYCISAGFGHLINPNFLREFAPLNTIQTERSPALLPNFVKTDKKIWNWDATPVSDSSAQCHKLHGKLIKGLCIQIIWPVIYFL